MDHHEAVRKFEHLMLREADHAREVATELEALARILVGESQREIVLVNPQILFMNYLSKVDEYNKYVHGVEKKDYSELVALK